MRRPRTRIDDLTECSGEGLAEPSDDQLGLIVGGMVNDGGEVSSLFDWDISAYGFGLDGGGGPDGGVPASWTPGTTTCPPGWLSAKPFEVYRVGAALPSCTSIATTTSPDAGGGADVVAN